MARRASTVTTRLRFVENPRSEQEILNLPRLFEKVLEDTLAAAEYARNAVPVLTGDLQKGIVVDVIETAKGPRGRVKGKDWKTLWFEEGSSKVRALHMLRTGVELQGYNIHGGREIDDE